MTNKRILMVSLSILAAIALVASGAFIGVRYANNAAKPSNTDTTSSAEIDVAISEVAEASSQNETTSQKEETKEDKPVVNSTTVEENSTTASVSSVTNQTSQITSATSSNIDKDKAKQIAVKDAGLKKSDVNFIKVEFSIDDGVKYYEVDFYADGVEYDYEIDALTGAILKRETEGKKQTTTQEKKQISKSKAKSLALKHAGVSEKDAYAISLELDRDNGRVYYEVEFKSGGYEYSCNVDAYSGEISDFEKEFDD